MLPDTNTGGYQRYYDEFIEAYDTHYARAAKCRGVAKMETVITQDYYSTHFNSDIKANLRVAWRRCRRRHVLQLLLCRLDVQRRVQHLPRRR